MDFENRKHELENKNTWEYRKTESWKQTPFKEPYDPNL